jgi:ABC-type multidrug transport system fused ATPase/permease subunit
LPYLLVKVLLIFQLYHPTKGTIVILEEAIASSPSTHGENHFSGVTKEPL